MNELPTIKQLYNLILAQLQSEFNITIPVIGKSYLRVQAAVLAASLRIMYSYIALVQKNIFPDTADTAEQGGTLERFGWFFLNRGPTQATAGQYVVNISGTAGATIKINTTFKSNDDSANPGYQFILDEAYTFSTTGVEQITLRALTAGLDSKLSIGDTLTANVPIANIDQTGTVDSISTNPIDGETTAEYRQRILEAVRLEAQGGAQADYILWAADASGAAAVYAFKTYGECNEVDLYVEASIDDSIDGKGSASTTILNNVRDAIETPTSSQPSKKPTSVIVNYASVTPLDVDITIPDFDNLTSSKQTLITEALTSYLNDVRPYLAGVTPYDDKNDTLDLNKIANVVINAVPGAVFGSPTLDVDGNAVSSYVFENGEIPYLNSVTIS